MASAELKVTDIKLDMRVEAVEQLEATLLIWVFLCLPEAFIPGSWIEESGIRYSTLPYPLARWQLSFFFPSKTRDLSNSNKTPIIRRWYTSRPFDEMPLSPQVNSTPTGCPISSILMIETAKHSAKKPWVDEKYYLSLWRRRNSTVNNRNFRQK